MLIPISSSEKLLKSQSADAYYKPAILYALAAVAAEQAVCLL